jgi:hypothetical protein
MTNTFSIPKNSDTLHRLILSALDNEVKRIVAEEAEAAAKRVEERVRGETGKIAAKVSSYVSYNTMRDEVIITVRFPEKNQA